MVPSARTFVGVDPGRNGAICVLDGSGEILYLNDLPIIISPKRVMIDPARMQEIFQQHCDPTRTDVWIEYAHAMPGDGVVQSFSSGFVNGSLHATIHIMGHIAYTVSASVWKRLLGVAIAEDASLPKHKSRRLRKERSIAVAHERVPQSRRYIVHYRHHNRADAVLIALFGKLCWENQLPVVIDEHNACHIVTSEMEIEHGEEQQQDE